jgi:hypothetical protein
VTRERDQRDRERERDQRERERDQWERERDQRERERVGTHEREWRRTREGAGERTGERPGERPGTESADEGATGDGAFQARISFRFLTEPESSIENTATSLVVRR